MFTFCGWIYFIRATVEISLIKGIPSRGINCEMYCVFYCVSGKRRENSLSERYIVFRIPNLQVCRSWNTKFASLILCKAPQIEQSINNIKHKCTCKIYIIKYNLTIKVFAYTLSAFSLFY